MRCSECSVLVRPVVAIDIDGTLGDYHGHLERFASAYLGKAPSVIVPEYDGGEPYRDWFTQAFGVDVTTFREVKLAYRQGGMKRTMPLDPYARDLLWNMKDLGAEVWLCTTRPYLRLDNIDPDTRFWLAKHDLYHDHLLYHEDRKYRELADRVDPERVAAVLDDENEQITRARLHGWTAILRCHRYNRAIKAPLMAAGLREASAMMAAHVDDWLRRHEETVNA